MKRIILVTILVAFGASQNTAFAQETNQRIAVSPAFATAQEAVEFANSLTYEQTLHGLRFSCKHYEGQPQDTAYYVTANTSDVDWFDFQLLTYSLRGSSKQPGKSMADLLQEQDVWSHREFKTPEEAVEWVNAEMVMPQFVSCLKRDTATQATTITVFYIDRERPTLGDKFEIVKQSFPTAEAAVDYTNSSLYTADENGMVQFLPELVVGKQVKSSWRVIATKPLSFPLKNRDFWHAFHASSQNELESFLAEQNKDKLLINNLRIVEEFNTYDIISKTVLFYYDAEFDNPEHANGNKDTTTEKTEMAKAITELELILPVRIFATKTLLEKSSGEHLQEITNAALNSFHAQISKVCLEVNYKIQEAPQVNSTNPEVLGNSLPYIPNTLAIFLTDQNFLIPETKNESERNISGRAGRSWVIVNVNVCDGCRIKPESVLLHEILHEFGVPHKQDPTSVMCQGLIIKSCPVNLMTIDKKSLAEANSSVKLIKKIGFDTYTGLVTRF